MGLYIEGLRLPKKGMYTSFTVYSDGRVVFKFGGDPAGRAVEVPAHGDLIDRNTAYDSLLSGMVMTGYQSRALDCISDFYVPTIIPAEGET